MEIKIAANNPLYIQTMLKSIRLEQHFKANSSPLANQTYKSFKTLLNVQSLIPEIPSSQPAINKTENTSQISEIENILVKIPASAKDFIQQILPHAKQAAAAIPGLNPCILIAQAALETGWGKYLARDSKGNSSNNFFNIKACHKRQNEAVEVNTTEYFFAIPVRVKAFFKMYSSPAQSFMDYVALIKNNKRYAVAKANVDNPQAYFNALQQAGYATDPQYASKMVAIFKALPEMLVNQDAKPHI